MQCPRCHAANREGRRFCSECGAALAHACPLCGFTNEPGEREVMADKPRPKTEPILNREVKTVIAIIGIVTNILLLGFFWLLHQFSGYDITSLRTMLFTILAILSLSFLLDYLETDRTRAADASVLLAIGAAFTYELGSVYCLLAALASVVSPTLLYIWRLWPECAPRTRST